MKFLLTPLATLALFSTGALAQSFTINTPTNAVVCQPLLLSWSGGTAPYFLSVLPGDQPSGTALESLGQQTGTSFTWTVDIAAGTSVGLTLRDSTGATAQTAPFSILPGGDASCVGQGTSAGGSSTGSSTDSGSTSATGSATTVAGSTTQSSTGSTTTAASTTTTNTAPATTPTVSATRTTSVTGSSTSRPAGSSTGASGSSTTPSSAASTQAAHIGAAGMIGAALIAILA